MNDASTPAQAAPPSDGTRFRAFFANGTQALLTLRETPRGREVVCDTGALRCATPLDAKPDAAWVAAVKTAVVVATYANTELRGVGQEVPAPVAEENAPVSESEAIP